MKLRNKRGEVFAGTAVLAVIVFAAVHYGITTGKNIFEAKPKTVDTIENPAAPLVPYGPNNYK